MSIIGGWPRPCARTTLRALPHRTLYSCGRALHCPTSSYIQARSCRVETRTVEETVNFVHGWTRTQTGRNYSTLRIQNSDVGCLHVPLQLSHFIFRSGSFSSAKSSQQVGRSVSLLAVTFSELFTVILKLTR